MMIVVTKLHIPQPRTSLVTRTRLIQRLHEGLDRTLTLITAPAGYGKTTLLSEWANTLKCPVAWVSMDSGDNDRIRFWAHTIASLKQACPAFNAESVLRFAVEDSDSFIAALINGLHRLSQTIILIWDDFHHIKDPAILKGIIYLLERMPNHIHLYIASRTIPPFSLSRIRAGTGLVRLGVSDLRFLPEETSLFFTMCGKINLSEEEAATVQEKTEGWATAMRLLVLSLHEQADPASLVSMLTGTERDISDYFFEEVLSRQPEKIQQFLLKTSVLDRMTGELCMSVTGMSESKLYLQHLDQLNLFLVPLDEQREWYRYHHLFQQFLTAQLQRREPKQWNALQIAAGKWFEENGCPHEAVDHYLAGAGYEEALMLLEAIAPELLVYEWTTLYKWLNDIPVSLLSARPMLFLTKLASQYMSGRVEEATDVYWQAVRWLEKGADNLPPHQSKTLHAGLAFLAAFRTFLDRDFDYAVQYSEEYVSIHPEGDFFIGFGGDKDGWHPVWDIYVSDDSITLAKQILTPLISIWSETRNVYFVAHLCIDFGKLQYECNRLDEAEKYMRRANDIGKSYDNPCLATVSALWLARIATVQGDEKNATAIVKQLSEQPALKANPHLSGKIALFQAMLGKKQGEEEAWNQWLISSGLRFQDEIPLSMINEYAFLASLLAEEEQIEESIALTDRLLFIAIQAGRKSDRIRLLVYKSLFLSLQGNAEKSTTILEEALALAWPEGYIRTFIDEGIRLRKLLDQYLALRQKQHHRSVRKVPLTYVKQLLRLFPRIEGVTGEMITIEGNMPILTAKEKCVLHLMEKGLSNKELASQLNISLATVKTHINNIYGKLQVKSRLQALERANTLQLF